MITFSSIRKLSLVSVLALTTQLTFSHVWASDTTSTYTTSTSSTSASSDPSSSSRFSLSLAKPYAFLNLKNRNALFAQASAGNKAKQIEVMDKYYSGLIKRFKDESFVDMLGFLSWANIQETANQNHRCAYFIIHELKPEIIKASFPKLIDNVIEQKNKGIPEYTHLYGWLCAKGLATDPNPGAEQHLGVKWFKAAGENGLARGIYDAMNQTYWVDADEQILNLKQTEVEQLAIAQYRLGEQYEWVKKSRLAVQSYTRAAEQGHPAALNRLGEIYSEGKGVERDMNKAIAYWAEAVEQDDPQALYSLGMAYYRGNGVTQNFPYAKDLFTKAIAHDEPRGYYGLGLMYAEGKGTQVNESLAIEQFQSGANRKGAYAK